MSSGAEPNLAAAIRSRFLSGRLLPHRRRDRGLHIVCAITTDESLEFSFARGNDLSTPVPEFGFPGLVAGDRWCLCVTRWQEAFEAECAPPVILAATRISALEFVALEDLQEHAARL